MHASLRALAALGVLVFATSAYAETLADVEDAWVEAKYNTHDKAAQEKALNELTVRADAIAVDGDPEAKIWQAVILATRAKLIGGTSALDDIRQAKNLLEGSMAANPPSVVDGYADALLGALYGKAPGWPISFGDLGKARTHFAKALERNPGSIDANFLYGEFLHDQGKDVEARVALEKALQAAPRKGREAADTGRRTEIQSLMAKLPPA